MKVILILFLLVLAACDDRTTALKDLNEKPSIFLQKEKESGKEKILYDSVKISISKFAYTPLYVIAEDVNDNIKCVRYKIEAGKGLLQYRNENISDTLPGINTLVKFIPNSSGKIIATFLVEDRFGATDSAQLNIVAFTNIAPIAHLDTTKIAINDPYEYEFDASQSIDPDQKFGGIITYYYYTINNESIKTLLPKIKYIFPGKGTYNVSLKVQDNDNSLSAEVKKQITL